MMRKNGVARLPLVLISEVQRSGGSMMSQLLDGHPNLMTHPFEIHIGFPNKWDWPQFDFKCSPTEWFNLLYEKKIDAFLTRGYTKPGSNKFAAQQRFPFHFDPALQRKIFLLAIEESNAATPRDILNCYFTSFFEAWHDYKITDREMYVAGFTPRISMIEESRNAFFRDYPDGKMISILRDPRSWYASTKKHNKQLPDVDSAISLWTSSAQAIEKMMTSHPASFLPLVFEDILMNPEEQMTAVARFIGIPFANSLCQPTYLGNPILPNSSFDVAVSGINKSMVDRSGSLEPAELRAIEGTALGLYSDLSIKIRDFLKRVPRS